MKTIKIVEQLTAKALKQTQTEENRFGERVQAATQTRYGVEVHRVEILNDGDTAKLWRQGSLLSRIDGIKSGDAVRGYTYGTSTSDVNKAITFAYIFKAREASQTREEAEELRTYVLNR